MRAHEFLTEAGANPIYYFAYGMLTDPKVMQGADFVGMAELKNFEFEMFAYANVRPEPGSVVYGVLWSINREMLSQLDITEDYPRLYDRKTVPVFVDGQRVEEFVYTMTPQTRDQLKDTYPRRSYIMRLARGYQAGGVPISQLQTSLSETTDPKFVGFMNKSLGNRVDTPGPDPLADAPDWYKNAPVQNMPADSHWGRAALWGLRTLAQVEPDVRAALKEAGEDAIVEYLRKVASATGAYKKFKFAEEDIWESQDYLDEIFHDPTITSWTQVI